MQVLPPWKTLIIFQQNQDPRLDAEFIAENRRKKCIGYLNGLKMDWSTGPIVFLESLYSCLYTNDNTQKRKRSNVKMKDKEPPLHSSSSCT